MAGVGLEMLSPEGLTLFYRITDICQELPVCSNTLFIIIVITLDFFHRERDRFSMMFTGCRTILPFLWESQSEVISNVDARVGILTWDIPVFFASRF